MNEVFLDTETTGLSFREGHKVVEVACIETKDLIATGRVFHKFINPKRNIPDEAFKVHGFSEKFLSDKQTFDKIADEFLDFISGKKIIIHNASFDMKFINAELALADKKRLPADMAIDTLAIARKKFPGSPASLDALCRRFNIDNSARTLHGALLDSEILAEVYLELIGGRQPDFGLSDSHNTGERKFDVERQVFKRANPLKPRLTIEEEEAHTEFVQKLGESAMWNKLVIKN